MLYCRVLPQDCSVTVLSTPALFSNASRIPHNLLFCFNTRSVVSGSCVIRRHSYLFPPSLHHMLLATCSTGESFDPCPSPGRPQVHATQDDVQCGRCGLTISKHRLADHIETEHGHEPFSCATCRKRFKRNQQYLQHMRVGAGRWVLGAERGGPGTRASQTCGLGCVESFILLVSYWCRKRMSHIH